MAPFMLLALTGVVACGSSKKSDDTQATEKKVVIKAPAFDADSAFTYVKAQTDFGPRVPNTQAHKDCGEYTQRHRYSYRSRCYRKACQYH